MIGLVIPLLIVVVIVVAVVVAIQRSTKKEGHDGGGADLVAYLVLALSVGVAGFALAQLVSTAFPGDRFIFDPTQNLSASVAALVVSVPFAIYFWRRQSQRRVQYPESVGWTLYLTLMELVFLTAFVVSAVLFVNGLLSEERASAWTGTVVFGAIVLMHEFAARRNPPQTEAGELRRVAGSAIGLITGTIGLAGTLVATFETWFGPVGFEFDPWLAMLVVGVPIWAYRWLSTWPTKPETPRTVWIVAVSTASLATAIGAGITILILVLQYVIGSGGPAGQHFDEVSVPLGMGLAALAVWGIHRRAVQTVSSSARAFHYYLLAGASLAVAITSAVALTIFALGERPLVGGGSDDVIATTAVLIAVLGTWGLFTRAAHKTEESEATAAWPRKIYFLGLGVVVGIVAAAALITTLVVLINRLLDSSSDSSVLEPMAVLLYSGLATWYLLGRYARDRSRSEERHRLEPFDVTIVASHPGHVAVKFPEHARLKVIHRGDGKGTIDDETADQIVAAVDNTSSVVWVDEDGFRVAPLRRQT